MGEGSKEMLRSLPDTVGSLPDTVRSPPDSQPMGALLCISTSTTIHALAPPHPIGDGLNSEFRRVPIS